MLKLVWLEGDLERYCEAIDDGTDHDDEVPPQLEVVIGSENEFVDVFFGQFLPFFKLALLVVLQV